MTSLSTGEMQMILIAKALFHNAKIISFDEPTSALTDREVDRLLKMIMELKDQGITILYITHRLDEVFAIADRASILRDGTYITTPEHEGYIQGRADTPHGWPGCVRLCS